MTQRGHERVAELLILSVEGAATREETAELEALLQDGPAVREFCVDFLIDLSCLQGGQGPVDTLLEQIFSAGGPANKSEMHWPGGIIPLEPEAPRRRRAVRKSSDGEKFGSE